MRFTLVKLNARVAAHRVAVTDRAGIQRRQQSQANRAGSDTVKPHPCQSVTERVNVADKRTALSISLNVLLPAELVLDVAGASTRLDTRNGGPADDCERHRIVGQQVGAMPASSGRRCAHRSTRRAAQPVASSPAVCHRACSRFPRLWSHREPWQRLGSVPRCASCSRSAQGTRGGSQVVCRWMIKYSGIVSSPRNGAPLPRTQPNSDRRRQLFDRRS